jgi:hypothetical protein
MIVVEDMSGTRRTVMALLFAFVGASTISAFRMPTTQLRALGLGRHAQWTHLAVSTVAGAALYLVCITAMWGVERLRGVEDGPRYWLTGVIIVALAGISVLTAGRKVGRGGTDGAERSAGGDGWGQLAQQPDGHRRVMERMAQAGTVTAVVGFFLVMVPGQLVFRGMFDGDPATVGFMLTLVLAATTVFVRVVQAERAAEIWMIYGGAPRVWQHAVLRRAWIVPVAFVSVYLLA